MKPAPPMSPRKTGNASRTSGEGGWQPSPDVVALPTQVRRSVITADALPKVRAFHDQTFMTDLPGLERGEEWIPDVRRSLSRLAAGPSTRRLRRRRRRSQAR